MRARWTTAVLAAVATVGVAVTSACSSSGGPAAPSSSTVAVSSPVTTPVTTTPSTSSPPIALPQPTSTAKSRATPLRVPPGARPLTFKECSDTIDDLVGIEQDMGIVLVGYPKTPQIAIGNFKALPPLLTKPLQTLARLHGYWLAAGYPSTFPTVRDVDAMTVWAHRLLAAARAGNIAAVPGIYLPYNSALDQYSMDANDTLCPQ